MLTYLNTITGVYNSNKSNITFNGSLQGNNEISNIKRLVFIFRSSQSSYLPIGNPTGANPIRITHYGDDVENSINVLLNMGNNFICSGLTLEIEDTTNYFEEFSDNEKWEHFIICKAMPQYPYINSSVSGYNFIQTNTKTGLYPIMYDKNIKVVLPCHTSDEIESDIDIDMLIFYE